MVNKDKESNQHAHSAHIQQDHTLWKQLHKITIHPEEDLENQSLISFLSFEFFHVR